MRAALIALMMLILVPPARGAAPQPGTEDYEVMQPFADAISKLQVGGSRCCDWSDGRIVRAQRCQVSAKCPGGWRVRFLPGNDIGAPFDRWLPVPEGKASREPNPVGVPIAWFRGGTVMCFWPVDDT